jgi:hypothetical protein
MKTEKEKYIILVEYQTLSGSYECQHRPQGTTPMSLIASSNKRYHHEVEMTRFVKGYLRFSRDDRVVQNFEDRQLRVEYIIILDNEKGEQIGTLKLCLLECKVR